MNTVVLELEKLILSYQNLRVDEDDNHPGLEAIQREVFEWLGYEPRSVAAHTILVVDDVLENIMLVSDILKQVGCQIYSASNGSMALSVLQEIQPDLILLDVSMPDMDGYQLLQMLRQIDRLRSIPVIFLSARNTTADRQKAEALGAASFITKPFKMAFVIEQVQQQLGAPLSRVNRAPSRMETRRHRARHTSCLLCDPTQAGFQATSDGRYLRVSSRLAQICGYPSASAMISEVTNLWDQIYCDLLHQYQWSQSLACPNQIIQFESQIRQQDGYFLQIVEQVKAVQDAYGHFLFYEGSIKL
jgi:CheY-like chemotaxis protein